MFVFDQHLETLNLQRSLKVWQMNNCSCLSQDNVRVVQHSSNDGGDETHLTSTEPVAALVHFVPEAVGAPLPAVRAASVYSRVVLAAVGHAFRVLAEVGSRTAS